MQRAATVRRFRAPGRFNIIGEHVDYCGGVVLPAAIGQGTETRVRLTGGDRLSVRIGASGGEFGFARQPVYRDWEGYVAGMAAVLAEALGLAGPPGAALEIDGQVPVGMGMSSSAALEVSVGLALWTVWADAGAAPAVDRLQLARLAQRAEHQCAGNPCGLMDQYASVFGEAGRALLLDCRSETHDAVPVPDSLAFVVVDCGVRHALVDGAYARRRADTRAAACQLGVASLREVASVADLAGLSGDMLRRARHVVGEVARTRAAASALAAGDVAALGALMAASHASLRDDMEVSTAELDGLQALAVSRPEVFGARMMGGGFGGSVIALVPAAAASDIGAVLAADWGARIGHPVQWQVCTPSAGAREL